MEIIQAIVLGIVQGIAEWLPVSSEGINALILVNFFGKSVAEAVPIAIWLHLGTLLSAIIFFRKDIAAFGKELPKIGKESKFILIATVFTGIIGGLIYLLGVAKLDIKGEYATAFIGILLIITGILQMKAKKENPDKKLSVKDSILVGGLQGLAVLPGISRSGISYSTMLLRKFDAKKALRLSFLLSIPAVLAAEVGLLVLGEISFSLESVISVVVAFVVGMVSIKYFLKLAAKLNFGKFCVILGIISFIPFLTILE
jgi:undecaprenyl-diphosphatase